MNSDKNLHIPVLAKEIVTYLGLKKGAIVLDCTVGAGGHAENILKEIGPSGHLIGIDRDEEILHKAKTRLTKISEKFALFHSNYKYIDSILANKKLNAVDGALFDLGVSSFQMDAKERGFSIKLDGPLDMRMNKDDKIKASDIVNDYGTAELVSIFKEYGDEYFAKRIVSRIERERKRERIENTKRLAKIVEEALPYRYRFRRIHPATKVFMALRIAVNRETESLQAALTKVTPFLSKGARICVISFHSIEDRIVKNRFREFAKSGVLQIVTKKPVRPGREEIINNPRSRSAKLRVAEKL